MKDARLTGSGGVYDLKLDEGVLGPWCYDGTQVANHGLIRIRTFRGERAIDKNWGTQWYQIIFDASVAKVEKELEIKRQILSLPGVEYIEEFEMTQDGNEYNVTGIVQTEFGTETFEMVMAL
jgi:hypothetical protein